jgi:hypothetical protein
VAPPLGIESVAIRRTPLVAHLRLWIHHPTPVGYTTISPRSPRQDECRAGCGTDAGPARRQFRD